MGEPISRQEFLAYMQQQHEDHKELRQAIQRVHDDISPIANRNSQDIAALKERVGMVSAVISGGVVLAIEVARYLLHL